MSIENTKQKPNMEKNNVNKWSIPCIVCVNIDKCGIGQEWNPISCKDLNEYIKNNECQ